MAGHVPGVPPDGGRRSAMPRDRAVDFALAGAAVALNVAGSLSPDPAVSYDLLTGHLSLVVMSAAAGASLLVRRRHPLVVFVAVLAITTVVTASDWQPGNLPVTLILASYALGAFGTRESAVVGLGTLAGCYGMLFAIRAPYFDTPIGLAAVGQVVLAWALGCAVRERRMAARRARAREAELAREGAREIERAVLAERLRVARELNGAVAEALTAITVQAAAGRRAGDPDGVLAEIERSGRNAGEDLRRLLRALRGPGPPDTKRDPPARAGAVPGVTVVDLALGGCVALFNVSGSVLPDPSAVTEYDDPVLPALLVLASVPGLALILRRRYPVAVFLVVVAAVATVALLGWQTGNLPGSVLIAGFAVGAWAPVARGIVLLAGAVIVATAGSALEWPHFHSPDPWAALAIFTAPWVAGAVIRYHRMADQAQVDGALAAERARAAETERALAEERLAVARDLHDLVSHSLTAITVQAAASRRRQADEPGSSVAVIEQVARAAVADLRTMLDLLQRPEGASLVPAPGIPEIEELVARHRAEHGPVELSIDPRVDAEPESLRTTAYRMVREALTNAVRHAPGARVMVRVTASERGVGVEVENAASSGGHATPGSGWGLVGMGERVALVGGSLTAAPTDDGGFAVHAELDRRGES